MKPALDPETEYRRRLEQNRAILEQAHRRFERLVNLRTAAGLICIVSGILALSATWFSAGWVTIPVAAFFTLVVLHQRTDRLRERVHLSVEYYERALRRLDNSWQGEGTQRADLADEEHPYAADLDLFGPASLFELLCTARTRAGEEILAEWLTGPAATDEIATRHEVLEELRPGIDLREELAVLGGGVRSSVDPDRLTRWGSAPPAFDRRSTTLLRGVALFLSAGLIVSLVLWAATGTGPFPFWIFVIAVWGFYSFQGRKMLGVMQALGEPQRELRVLSKILKRLEEEPVDCAGLKDLREALTVGGQRASVSIRRLDRLIYWLDAGRNQMFIPIAYALLWHFHFSLAVEAWRMKTGGALGRWLDAVGEYEAYCSLATYAFEHPNDPFPEFVEGEALFEGDDLGHPLLAEDVCVRNSVRLGDGVQGWVVSGSNMSGKSTLLRTVGINAVLAFAGAPVRAGSLRLSPLNIGATIRLEDSLQAGRSRFYAEINRLKALMDLTDEGRPLLFLLDEILHGTNSHDRQIGAAAIMKSLIEAGAIGLITTHDLALATTADELGERVVNMHFEDSLEEGRLVFDYMVKPGVVQKGNALDLMRSIGLDV